MAEAAGLNAFMENHEEKTVRADRKLRIGIIGTGGIAHDHMKAYLNQPDVEVVAGCDIVPGKAAAFFKEFGVENAKTDYKNHSEMLADKSLALDGVSICTYNRQHACCAIEALEAGLNVILEKPFTVTLDEAIEVMKAEKKSGKILSIGFQPRFDDNMAMIKKIVQSGELGEIYYIQTGGGRRRGIPVSKVKTTFIEDETAGIGALGDIGCYSLDMVMRAIGYPMPLTVSGTKSAYFGKDPNYCTYVKAGTPEISEKFGVDDFASAYIRLEGGKYGVKDGIILDFRISWAMNINTPGDTIILGTKGGLRIPSTDCWNGSVGGPMTIYHEIAGEQVETTVPLCGRCDLWNGKIRSFLDAIITGGKSPIPSSEIIINQAIIDGIARSSDEGKEIEIHIPTV